MKFIWISLLSFSLWGQTPILITFDNSKQKAKLAVKILTQKWLIPRILIELKGSSTPCQSEFSRTIHLCFNNSGEMAIMQYNQEVVDESFRIFFP